MHKLKCVSKGGLESSYNLSLFSNNELLDAIFRLEGRAYQVSSGDFRIVINQRLGVLKNEARQAWP